MKNRYRESAFDLSTPKGWLQRYFLKHGEFCAKYPYHVIFVCLVITGLLSAGLISLEREYDPQKMWVGNSSRSVKNRLYYDKYFGSDYREETLIITPKVEGQSIIKQSFMKELLLIQQEIMRINVTTDEEFATLK